MMKRRSTHILRIIVVHLADSTGVIVFYPGKVVDHAIFGRAHAFCGALQDAPKVLLKVLRGIF